MALPSSGPLSFSDLNSYYASGESLTGPQSAARYFGAGSPSYIGASPTRTNGPVRMSDHRGDRFPEVMEFEVTPTTTLGFYSSPFDDERTSPPLSSGTGGTIDQHWDGS